MSVALLIPFRFKLLPKLPRRLPAAVLSGIFDGLSGALHVGGILQLPEGLSVLYRNERGGRLPTSRPDRSLLRKTSRER